MSNTRATQYLVLLAVVMVLLAGCTFVVQPEAEAPAAEEPMAAVLPTDPPEVQIANAMAAAPMVIAKDATILGFPVEGEEMVLLREGTNGWTCIDRLAGLAHH